MEGKAVEPLLAPENHRYTTFPIRHKDIWEMYKKQQDGIWKAEEILPELAKDRKDWIKLDKKEQKFILHILAFFAASDGQVNENLGERFLSEVQLREAKAFYACQLFVEEVHNETYSLLIDEYARDTAEKKRLFNAVAEIPTIKKKSKWMKKWTMSTKPFAYRLLAFVFVEGIYFSSSFCAIYWFKSRNLLPGLSKSNEWIARDEGLHTRFAILLYTRYLRHKLPEAEVQAMIREAVSIESEFINGALPYDLYNMNASLMTQYVQFVADDILAQLGYSKLWNVKNPFLFMEQQSISVRMCNFFETPSAEYKSYAGGNQNAEDLSLDGGFDEDI